MFISAKNVWLVCSGEVAHGADRVGRLIAAISLHDCPAGKVRVDGESDISILSSDVLPMGGRHGLPLEPG